MGLDQYAYAVLLTAVPAGAATFGLDLEGVEREELAYWRKHPNLQGWMEGLYLRRGGDGDFNCVNLPLTLGDLDELEQAVTMRDLPATSGFFFGQDADDHYRDDDLKFIGEARKAIGAGKVVLYDSWW